MKQMMIFQEEVEQLHAMLGLLRGEAASRLLMGLEQAQAAMQAEKSYEEGRPMVVVLFGGTGVGKSSLFNALLGQNLSSVAVTRAHTTRPVVAYPAFARTYIEPLLEDADAHEVNSLNAVLVDTPDVDSMARDHADSAAFVAAHADIIIYVTTPRKYAYESAWEPLRLWAKRKHWFFVLNQCDLSEDPDQVKTHFMQLLKEQGFHPADDVCFQTSLAVDQEQSLELDRLKHLVFSRYQAEQLEELRQDGMLSRVLHLLGSEDVELFEALAEACAQQCHQVENVLSEKIRTAPVSQDSEPTDFDDVLERSMWGCLQMRHTGLFCLYVWIRSLLQITNPLIYLRQKALRFGLDRHGSSRGWRLSVDPAVRQMVSSERHRIRRWLEDQPLACPLSETGTEKPDDQHVFISVQQVDVLAKKGAKKAAHGFWYLGAHLLPLTVFIISVGTMLRDYVSKACFETGAISTFLFMLLLACIPGCYWLRVRVKHVVVRMRREYLKDMVATSLSEALTAPLNASEEQLLCVARQVKQLRSTMQRYRTELRRGLNNAPFGDAPD
ncbi:MAG: hypothetical protein EOL87_12195 [Spartobacteria bacterium]|nr:hypothetical protein [Spartobacteria bacterium]